MPFTANDIAFYYSGGAANANPTLSLGGAISGTRVSSQAIGNPVNVTGVTVVGAYNNAQGVGTLAWSSSTNILSWTPPSSVQTYGISVTTNAIVALGGATGTLILDCVFASMPGSFKQDSLNVVPSNGNVFDAVGPADSLIGDTEYRCFYVKNLSVDTTITAAKVWIKQLTTGPDEIAIGLAVEAAGDGVSTGVAASIANEDTAPAGVVFTQPTSNGTALNLGALSPGQCRAVWERRVVEPDTLGNITANTSTIAVSATL